MSQNLNWVIKLRHKLQTFLTTTFFNFGRKKKLLKWPFFYFFWQLHGYLSQNWDSDGHFEVLSVS